MPAEEKIIFAQSLIREAGVRLRNRSLNELKIHLKNEDISDLVSDADEQTEKFLVSEIRRRRKKNRWFINRVRRCGLLILLTERPIS